MAADGKAEDVDHDLRWVLAAWEEVSEVAAEIGGWDPIDRTDYLHEWAIEEVRVKRVRSRVESGELARARDFLRLEELVARNRPVLEAVFGRYFGPPGPLPRGHPPQGRLA